MNTKTRQLRKNIKAISPVLAVLMMIAVAIAGSLITYAWVTGYISFTTDKSGKAIMIQSIANTGTGGADLSIYVQNVGEGTVELDPDSCLYINGELTPCTVDPADGLIAEGDTATLLVTGGGAGPGEKIVAKVTTLLGTFTEKSTYPTLGGGGGGGPTPNPQWRKSITFNSGPNGVQGSNHVDFPVLISLTDSDLASRSAADAHDIYFASDAAGTTVLDFEIEQWTQGTGTLVAWVKVPSLSAGTTIYMIYGDQSISSLENPTGVWNSNYQAIYHLKEDPSGTAPQMSDSTANNNDGATYGGMTVSDQVTGEVDGALDLDGGNDYIEATDSASLSIGGNQITLSAWVRFTDTGSAEIIIAKPWQSTWHDGPEYFAYSLHLLDTGSNVAHARIWIRTNTGTGTAESGNINANTWYYLVGTYDGSHVRIYINGALSATGSRTGNIATRTTPLRLGTNGGYAEDFRGILDEVRISNTARSGNWISTEYNNMNNPTAFINVGTEEPLTP